jgi:hypothetical protein
VSTREPLKPTTATPPFPPRRGVTLASVGVWSGSGLAYFVFLPFILTATVAAAVAAGPAQRKLSLLRGHSRCGLLVLRHAGHLVPVLASVTLLATGCGVLQLGRTPASTDALQRPGDQPPACPGPACSGTATSNWPAGVQRPLVAGAAA